MSEKKKGVIMINIKDYNKYLDGKQKGSWFLFFLGILPLIPTTILFALSIFDEEFVVDNIWFNHMMFFIFIPLILFQLFAIQKLGIVGNYGETILLLIPTFIWLLPGHTEAMSLMKLISFVLILIGGFIYSIAMLAKYVKLRKKMNIANHKSKTRLTGFILIRLSFVLASVVSTLIISILLVNWADHSLHLADTTVNGVTTQDYTSSGFITFIAVTTIFVALLLVGLGLISNFNKNFKKQNDYSLGNAFKKSVKINKKSFLTKTMIIKVPKRIKKKNKKK